MLTMLLKRLKRAMAVIRFGLLTLRYAGPRVALRKLGHQLCGRTVFLYTVADIEQPKLAVRFPCHTVRASPEDVKELFDLMKYESNDGKYHLLVRKWYHERGFGTPYVQKTLDTNEVCCIRWILTNWDIERAGFRDRFPELKEDEVMHENTYVPERFRNRGVQTSSQVTEILPEMGFKRSKSCVAENNTPELRFINRRGGKVYARVLERHLLFSVSRKTLEIYDPPIRVTTPPDNQ